MERRVETVVMTAVLMMMMMMVAMMLMMATATMMMLTIVTLCNNMDSMSIHTDAYSLSVDGFVVEDDVIGANDIA